VLLVWHAHDLGMPTRWFALTQSFVDREHRDDWVMEISWKEHQMFGTIGRGQPKPGYETRFDALHETWKQTVRPKIPGSFLELTGRPKDRPGEVVFIALAQDEATYRQLAELPEQHEFYAQMVDMLEAPPTWEDVELEIAIQD
jgi:hypothetical protein